mmetsp:Transcript_48182/g.127586  ORF Transcript_48182/g.127586 Transcript_48182/m.127586 type:complete len:146 (-) Transcript_48182:175-612(-)
MPKTSGMHGLGKKATRKNTHCDRAPANGYGDDSKRNGAGKANWGRPGDEMVEDEMDSYDPAYDSADELFVHAFGVPAPENFNWACVADLTEEDNNAMDEIDRAMEADWMTKHIREQSDIEDEAKAFFAFEAVRRQLVGRFSKPVS